MFSWFGSTTTTRHHEDLSPEDAQLVKTLLKFRDEFQEQHSPVVMSLHGLKNISNILYNECKFKRILWTDDMNQELPIMCSDYPQSTESHFSAPWGDPKASYYSENHLAIKSNSVA